MDIDDKKVPDRISEVIENDLNTENNLIEHFVTHAQDYLVQQHILRPAQMNTAAHS